MTREEALLAIIQFSTNKDEAFSQLAQYPKESETKLVHVTPLMLINNIKLYTQNLITSDDLEFWANFIEIREDINFNNVEDEIYALSNPDLMGEITVTKMNRLISILENPHIKH
ncbi:hypothetical protein CJF42_07765 [Pseudoalteromonas sp. NBT06-2]|uniref:hypothetical protein n=1 Tax=Pseudoalteromonas sp. NBT06-2 TaxID=2025950 RepID=UPI000BA5D259|nr:hypothetical protein [Pseudoalteromonas sp. NBT06-2]PAJ74962.1 hypothetical protein CJF42_07765 [Pseudoalteromonas sp. NBT06-2]